VVAICGSGDGGDAASRGLRRIVAPSVTAARRGEGASSLRQSSSSPPPRGVKSPGKVRGEGVDGITERRTELSCRTSVLLGEAAIGHALVAA